MTPPSVILDAAFLEALAADEHERRAVARDLYATLVEGYACHELRLRARSDHLAPHRTLRRTLFAPVETVHVAAQHRRAAARLVEAHGLDIDAAVTLVVMRREGIRRIATFDPLYSDLDDVEVVRRA